MAKYFTDFSEYVIGEKPSDWTNRWYVAPANDWIVVESPDDPLKKALLKSGESITNTNLNANSLLSWDVIDADPDRAEIHVITRTRKSNDSVTSAVYSGVAIRASGTSEATASAYITAFRRLADQINITRILGAGVGSTLAATDALSAPSAWKYFEFKVSGDQLKSRNWEGSLEDAPVEWSMETTDVNISIAGHIGMYCRRQKADYYWDFIGVGTGGDTPPIAPISSSITLSVDSISLSMTMESPTLSQANQLAVDDIQLQSSLDAVTLQQANVLRPDDISLSSFMGEVTLSSAGQLSVNSMQLNIGLESVELQQSNVLAVNDLLLTTTFESPDLSVDLTLVPDSIWLSVLLDQVELTQSHLLTVDDLTQSISLDNVTLTVAGQVIGPGTLTIGITGPSISIGISP